MMPGKPRVTSFMQLLGYLWDCFVCRNVWVFNFQAYTVMASDESGLVWSSGLEETSAPCGMLWCP